MAIIIQPKRWSIKPPLGVQINRGHSLANGLVNCWLLNEFGCSSVFDLQGQQTGVFGGATLPVWAIAYETGVQSASANTQGVTLPTGQINTLLNTTSWSLVIKFTPLSATATKHNQFGASQVNNSRSLMIDWPSGGQISVGEENVAIIITSSVANAAGVPFHAVWTVNGTAHSLYINGVLTGSATYTFGGSYSGNYYLSSPNASSTASNSTIHSALLYNRALTASEVQRLYSDPYCFLQPQSPQRRFWVSAAPVVNTDPPFGVIGQPTPHYSPNIIVV